MMAIAIGLFVMTATASNAFAKDKPKHAVVITISADSLTVTEKGATENTTYPIADTVSLTINGDPVSDKFADAVKASKVAVGDKITFTLTDGKVTTIKKGRKPAAPK